MKEQKNKKIKIVIIVLAVLLVGSTAALAGTLIIGHFQKSMPASVVIPNNIITPEGKERPEMENDPPPASPSRDETTGDSTSPTPSDQPDAPSSSIPAGTTSVSGTKADALSLHHKNPEDNKPFQAANLFPGDRETKYYCVQASYKGDIIVRYHSDIRPGYEKLAEVLKVRVRLLEEDETLYDGLMRDMPESLNHALYTNKSTQSELYYEITAYLDTSVGNEYMDKDLLADFRWWVEETGHLEPPQTGDTSLIYLWICLAAGSLIMLILLGKRRKKEAADEQ